MAGRRSESGCSARRFAAAAERVRRALGDDPAADDDRDAIGQALQPLPYNASSARWSCRATLQPRESSSHASSRASGSKPVVGSSRKISSGSPTRANATSSRLFLAARQFSGARVALIRRAQPASIISATALRLRIAAPDHPSSFPETVRNGSAAVSWADDADALLQARDISRGIMAEHATPRPRSAFDEAFEDFNRRGLAGAVRPKHSEYLPGLAIVRSMPPTACTAP